MVIPTKLPATAPETESIWNIPKAPEDAILGLTALYRSDSRPNALNLSIGVYLNEKGNPHEFRAVQKVRQRLNMDSQLYNHQYLPINGSAAFNKLSSRLIFGNDLSKEPFITTIQTLSGSGALRVALEFCARVLHCSTVFLSSPTWPNHPQLASDTHLKANLYRYYNHRSNSLDEDGLLSDLQNADHHSVVLFQPFCHNPTGVDPSWRVWMRILQIVRQRGCVVLFDVAYLGLSSGDVEQDAKVIRLFARTVPTLVCQSYSKCMGLYNSRIGSLSVCTPQCPDIAPRVLGQLKRIIRTLYASPPLHGATIVEALLTDVNLESEWKQELSEVVKRIKGMRKMLHYEICKQRIEGNWDHIEKCQGMFCFLGLKKEDVELLRKQHGIYLTSDSRVNVAGLTNRSVKILVQALVDVLGREKK